ncbi:MAG: LUD domain-containing protein [Rhizomicrobium sp.]
MSARDAILESIRVRRLARAPMPGIYRAPRSDGDLAEVFAKKMSAQHADVRMLDSMAEVPAAIADILRGRNMAATVHVPPGSELETLALPNVEVRRGPPGPFDAAVTRAPFAIAETGTLVYPSGKGAPASWHFRPVLEIAILRAGDVVAELEDVLAKLGPLPSTLNLVSGPSRTGDIEQTMELGAHGPKALAVLVVRH